MNELSKLPTEASIREKVNKIATFLLQIESQVDKLKVATDKDLEFATDILSRISKEGKTIEGERKNLTQPVDAYKKNIMSYFKPFTDKIDLLKKTTKDRMLPYQQEKAEAARKKAEAERQEELKRLEAERKAEERRAKSLKSESLRLEAEQAATDAKAESERLANQELEISTKSEGTIGNTHLKKVWKVEVVDINKVPREYLRMEVKISDVQKAAKAGLTEIAGLKIYETEEVVAR